ncbi:hypothetical protein EJ110_NYTH49446 [Nymphaea thermarum]|nr:hypothetical protein EJ110_NYTH49446 [Nymphaea thermarum]
MIDVNFINYFFFFLCVGLQDLRPQTHCFSLKQIKKATKDFDRENKIGEGGFGPVYKSVLHIHFCLTFSSSAEKGTLGDGTLIAVKQLSSRSRQGNREFLNEIGMISALEHPNLVKLFGCSVVVLKATS